MKRDERRQVILDLLAEGRAVVLGDLAKRFAVSKATIHRDLRNLEQAGLLLKTRGGATIETGTRLESDFRLRTLQDGNAKERMARAALELIEPGMTVIVNDGSMAACLGELLVEKCPLNVITNNAAVIEQLRGEAGITLIALGGVYSARLNGFFGLVTEDALARLRVDLAFISAPAVAGLQAFHVDGEVVRARRAMLVAANRGCLLVNHHRFGHSALHRLADLTEFDTIITDASPAPETRAAFDRAGIALTIAGS